MARKTTVNTQMGGFKRPSLTASPGVYDHNPAPPFTAPRAMGGGAIPTKFVDSGPSKAPKPSDGLMPGQKRAKSK